MQYTELGKTKENVSILGFGAMRLPTKGSNDNIDENTASEILSYGIDNGINLIDTAYPYHSAGIDGNGNSEVFIGNFLKENSYRDDVLISTKSPSWLMEEREILNIILTNSLKNSKQTVLIFIYSMLLQRMIGIKSANLEFWIFLMTV